MLQFGSVLILLTLTLQVLVSAESFAQTDDVALDAFKRAERHKREIEDKGVLAKCAQPLLQEDDDEVIEESLPMCLVREGMKKQMAGTDTAAGMIKRMQKLVKDDTVSVSLGRRGWWRKAVNSVKGWFQKHGKTIAKGIKIAADIIKAIWGKK